MAFLNCERSHLLMPKGCKWLLFTMLKPVPTVVFASGAAAVDSTRLGLSEAAANTVSESVQGKGLLRGEWHSKRIPRSFRVQV